MPERITNNATTTTTIALDAVTNPATLTVANPTGFPSIAPFRIIVDNELMKVTAGAGTSSWTVARAQEGTALATHTNGATITEVVTAFQLASMRQEYNVVAYGAVGDGVTNETTAFQNAINDAHAATSGGIVYIPPGSYNVVSALTTYSNVVFRSDAASLSGTGAANINPLIAVDQFGNVRLPGQLIVTSGQFLTGALNMQTAAAQIVGGATSLSLRNNANNADNLLVTDAGAVTVRAGLTVSASGITVTGNSTITGTLGGLTGLTVASGGATITTGGLTVSAGTTTLSDTTTYSKDLKRSNQAPVFAASYTPDAKAGEFIAMTLTNNITVNAPTNGAQGQKISFLWTQDVTGGRTITYNAAYKTGGGATLVTTASTVTIDTFYCVDGTNWRLISRITGQA